MIFSVYQGKIFRIIFSDLLQSCFSGASHKAGSELRIAIDKHYLKKHGSPKENFRKLGTSICQFTLIAKLLCRESVNHFPASVKDAENLIITKLYVTYEYHGRNYFATTLLHMNFCMQAAVFPSTLWKCTKSPPPKSWIDPTSGQTGCNKIQKNENFS